MCVAADGSDLQLVLCLQPGAPVGDYTGGREFLGEKIVFAQAAACGRAGPGIILGAIGDARANGVALNVADGGPDVRFVERAGEESALPEVSGFSAALVDGGGEGGVGVAKAAGERVLVAGDDDPVNVVGHEAIGPGVEAVSEAVAME